MGIGDGVSGRAIAAIAISLLVVVGAAVGITVAVTGGDSGQDVVSVAPTGLAPTAPAVTTAPPMTTTQPPTSTTTPVATTTTVAPRPVLSLGSRGTDVVALQQRLLGLGFDPGAIDGEFGPATARAVAAFQVQSDLRADGTVGAETWSALDKAKGLPPAPAAPTTVPPTTAPPTTPPPPTATPTTVAPTTVPPTTAPPPTVAPTTVLPTTVPPATSAPGTPGAKEAAALQRRLLKTKSLGPSNRGVTNRSRFVVAYRPGHELVITWAVNSGVTPITQIAGTCTGPASSSTTTTSAAATTTTTGATTTTITATTTTTPTPTTVPSPPATTVDPATLATKDRARFEARQIVLVVKANLERLDLKRLRLTATYRDATAAEVPVAIVSYPRAVVKVAAFPASAAFDAPPAQRVGCVDEAFR